MDISNSDVTGTPVATGGRRKSGRAVRVPNKFAPEVLSAPQAPTGAKRKRGGEETENDASDLEEEDESSDEDVESASEAEEMKVSRRKARLSKQPTAKKVRVNGTVSRGSATAVKLPNRPKKGKKVAIADKSADGLYGKCTCLWDLIMSILLTS